MGQKIIFVTGKGGVGKSTVAAAVALAYARAGKRTLLVELTEKSFFQLAWGKEKNLAKVSYDPINVCENMELALWSPQDCLRDYALHLLKVESLYQLFFNNPVMRTLINVAPALKELAILGKITSQPRHHGPPAPHEVLVVDAYATGHFLALLAAPGGMAQAVQFGPMGEQSRGIDACLRNPDICEYQVVTLPEELPIQETSELVQQLKEKFGISPQIILNKTLRASDIQIQTPFSALLKNENEKRDYALDYFSKKNLHFLEMPWIVSASQWSVVEKLADQMKVKPV